MNAVMGSVPRAGGEVFLEGRPLPTKSFQVVNAGVSISPEGRKVFAPLTTYENLRMGAFPQKSETDIQGDLRKVYDLFPRLEERKDQYAGTLSGGSSRCWPSAGPSWLAPGCCCWTNPPWAWRPSSSRRSSRNSNG
jgi:branched-chain amino acid transport system ATP-binding protein